MRCKSTIAAAALLVNFFSVAQAAPPSASPGSTVTEPQCLALLQVLLDHGTVLGYSWNPNGLSVQIDKEAWDMTPKTLQNDLLLCVHTFSKSGDLDVEEQTPSPENWPTDEQEEL